MRNLFKDLLTSEFSKNVITLATGTTISQAIPIAISPILTRLYSPEDFGILALFLSIVAVFSAVINGKYEMAILLPKSDEEALSLVKLAFYISTSISFILFVIVFLFNENIVELLQEPMVSNWLYFVPLATLFIGTFNALNLYNTREKNYKQIAISAVGKSSGLVITQIFFGIVKNGPIGLILGQLASYIFGNSILLKSLKSKKSKLFGLSRKQLSSVFRKYKKFPLLTLPGALLNTLTINSTNFFITAIYDSQTLGFYSLSNRVLGSPSMVIGKSISKVYFQQASKIRSNGLSIRTIFLKTLKKLSTVSIPLFVLLYFIIEPIFRIVFGEDWIVAGSYAKILIPLMCVRFISSSLSNTLTVLEKQEFTLGINFILFASTIVVFVTARSLSISFEETLKIFTLTVSILYLSFTLLYYILTAEK